jgi:hypothetical protein
MPPEMGIIVFIIFAIFIAFGIYWGYQQQLKRREELGALAAKLAWSFDSGHDSGHDDQYGQFGVFQRGHSRYAYNTLRGNLEIGGQAWPARMGDYTYKVTSGSGKNRRTTTYRFSYLILHLPYGKTPSLTIRREGVFDKLAGAFGFDDIDFESEEFSRMFHVKSGDKRFAYEVIHTRMMEFMLSSGPPEIEIEHCACCMNDGGSTWSPEEFGHRVEWAKAFFELWPRHVTADLESRRA